MIFISTKMFYTTTKYMLFCFLFTNIHTFRMNGSNGPELSDLVFYIVHCL